MTNMTQMQAERSSGSRGGLGGGSRILDPIDELIPRPRRHLTRFGIAVGVLSVVGLLSFAFGFGYAYPRPECCGSGSGSAPVSLNEAGDAVIVSAYFFNSSGRDLEVTAASARLEGARVVSTGFLPEDYPSVMPFEPEPFPGVVPGHSSARIAIEFVPERCDGESLPWGSTAVDLRVVNSWVPSFGRTYELPDALVGGPAEPLDVFPPAGRDVASTMTTPLAAACALLGIEP